MYNIGISDPLEDFYGSSFKESIVMLSKVSVDADMIKEMTDLIKQLDKKEALIEEISKIIDNQWISLSTVKPLYKLEPELFSNLNIKSFTNEPSRINYNKVLSLVAGKINTQAVLPILLAVVIDFLDPYKKTVKDITFLRQLRLYLTDHPHLLSKRTSKFIGSKSMTEVVSLLGGTPSDDPINTLMSISGEENVSKMQGLIYNLVEAKQELLDIEITTSHKETIRLAKHAKVVAVQALDNFNKLSLITKELSTLANHFKKDVL